MAALYQALNQWAAAVENNSEKQVPIQLISQGRMRNEDVTQVDISKVVFTRSNGRAIAGPVVIVGDQAMNRPSAFDLIIDEQEDGWRISSAVPLELPDTYLPSNLPEHSKRLPVRFCVTDMQNGDGLYSRVRITDSDGEYWPPDGHQKNIRIGWRQDVGGDVSINGEVYAYVPPCFTARLPLGSFSIEVRKGNEYRPAVNEFNVDGDETAIVEVKAKRWIDMNSRGWFSGDTHTHFLNDASGMKELQAEDLNMLYVLAAKWSELITDAERFTGKPSTLSKDKSVLVVNQEARHGWLGHTILHGISDLIYPLSWGDSREGVNGGMDYPPMAEIAAAAKEQGGLVTWAHFPVPRGELAVDVVLGQVDTIDLFTWGSAFTKSFDGRSALDWWYAFLNTGFKLAATAGTDKMINVQVAGSVRTYAYTGSQFDYDKWLKALKAGRTFVTTGPIIELTVNGKAIGSELFLSEGETVSVSAQVSAPYDLYPVDQLGIVVGGNVIKSKLNPTEKSRLEINTTIDITQSTWIAARASSNKLLPYQQWLGFSGIPVMAHSSPIYLNVNGELPWSDSDAQLLSSEIEAAIEWARNSADFHTEAQRDEVLELYMRAKAAYELRALQRLNGATDG